ncbi:aminotransferase class I/II-fold pyridoxal phosphate-dependent enzyme [Niallia sp. FSL W8-0635]|uniref:aminotransferase class I/II-fold pyridoxal phosphate-dependent enzyme n=1 Tax=Niallia sp. FSL W8-0635 TaxID=2975337 RepID=UPI0009D0690C|nr:Orn/Lys/Arg decarboxylase, major region [Mycobacteroides abscessus subsp. abscessus]HEO8421911.1 aminotransferase class I/II-fold pyridoxal phosphate-dependent enzyme [Yersinia enterocolitica]
MQEKTPLYSKLLQFQSENNISFHVPGHKNGELLSYDDNEWKRSLWKFDVTELNGLDDLHAPMGVIEEAEKLLTTLYEVKKSYFLVNGSTVGNLAMILSALKEGDKVFVQRNSHKSIMNGIKLAKAQPILLSPDYEEEWKVETFLSESTIKQAIAQFPEVKTLILTSPNYYGMVGDLKAIIQLAHDNGICVLVDEAHGAHFLGSDFFPPSAVQLGADIVVQSAHKTLPALTMGAYLHYNTDFIKQHEVKYYLEILQSSSPSYLIMSSLDKARYYLATYDTEDREYLQKTLTSFCNELQMIPQLKVLSYSHHGDPLKITVQSTVNISGFELQKQLEQEGVYTELADSNNVLFVFPLLKKEMDFPLNEVIAKIKKAVSRNSSEISNEREVLTPIKKSEDIVELKLSEKEQALRSKREVSLTDALHAVCAETIIPYPPGIPILMPGEEITLYHINQLKNLIKDGARFQGNPSIYENKIKIFEK